MVAGYAGAGVVPAYNYKSSGVTARGLPDLPGCVGCVGFMTVDRDDTFDVRPAVCSGVGVGRCDTASCDRVQACGEFIWAAVCKDDDTSV